MKKINSLIASLGIWMVLLVSTMSIQGCKKSEIPEFNNQYASIRFPFFDKEPSGYNDVDKVFVVSHSFVSIPDSLFSEIDVPVMLVGAPSESERPIKVEIVSDGTTASGEDYKIISASIPPKKERGAIRIKLMNSDRLKDEDLRVRLRLGSNDNFTASVKDFSEAVVFFGKKVPIPTNFEHIYTYNTLIKGAENPYSNTLEYYSPAAMNVIVQALGWTDWDNKEKRGNDFNGEKHGKYKYLPRYGYVSSNNRAGAFVKIIDEYIKKHDKEHPNAPLVHDDGKLKGKKIEARL